MKVLIPEKLAKEGIAVLEDAGCQVTFKPDTTPEELVELIPDYDGLIVRSATTVTREVIEAGKNLKVIGFGPRPFDFLACNALMRGA